MDQEPFDRPTKRPCLDLGNQDASELPNTPIDNGSDFYDTPLAMGTPITVEEISNTRSLEQETKSVIQSTIPGLGMLNGAAAYLGDQDQDQVPPIESPAMAKDTETDRQTASETGVTEILDATLERGEVGDATNLPEKSERIGQKPESQGFMTKDSPIGDEDFLPETAGPAPEAQLPSPQINIVDNSGDISMTGLNTEPTLSQSSTDYPHLGPPREQEIIAAHAELPDMPGVSAVDHTRNTAKMDHNTAQEDAKEVSDNAQVDSNTGTDGASHESEPSGKPASQADTMQDQLGDVPEKVVEPEGEPTVAASVAIPDIGPEKMDTSTPIPEDVSDGQIEESADLVIQPELPVNGNPSQELDPNNPEWEADSSPYDSSSSSVSTTSSESSSDEEDEEDDYQLLSPAEQARILMQEERGSDDEDNGDLSRVKDPVAAPSRIRTANEQLDKIVPIPDITLSSESKITSLGRVDSVVENTVVIKASVAGDYRVLDAGSLLCLADKTLVGVVAETLGRVQQPLYTVRFLDTGAIKERGVSGNGTEVFYADDHSAFVFTEALKAAKGTDASNIHDEEVGDNEMEFSDDEKEAEYKRQLKMRKRGRREGNDGFAKPPRGGFRPGGYGIGHSNDHIDMDYDGIGNTLSYDDDAGTANNGDMYDEGYTPLARPSNLQEMMGRREAPQEYWDRGTNSRPQSNGHSRGRGSFQRGGMRGGRSRGRDRRGFDHRGQGQRNFGDRRHSSYGTDQNAYPSSDAFPYGPPHAYQRSSMDPSSSQSTTTMPHSPSYQPSYSPVQTYPSQPNSYQQQQDVPPSWTSKTPHHHPQYDSYPQPLQNWQSHQSYHQSPYFPQPPNPYPTVYPPAGAHINPSFFGSMQQQQQLQHHPQPPQTYGSYNQQSSQSFPEASGTSRGGDGSGRGTGISDILQRLGGAGYRGS